MVDGKNLSRPINIAILFQDERSFGPTLANSLSRILKATGAHTQLIADPLRYIPSNNIHISKKNLIEKIKDSYSLKKLRHSLQRCDAICIVKPIPAAFEKAFPAEAIRTLNPRVPLILVSNYYLELMPYWKNALQFGDVNLKISPATCCGIDRYDWYFATSLATHEAMPPGPHRCTEVGLNLLTDDLTAGEQTEFLALLDFERQNESHTRDIARLALREAGVKYIELRGTYSISDIRRIYRQTSLYFLACYESFGLPIAEVQACGNYVLSPNPTWCHAHSIKPSLDTSELGEFTNNFVFYENTVSRLVEIIKTLRELHDPQQIRLEQIRKHPKLIVGNISGVAEFIDRLRKGAVQVRSAQ
jgi:hypothetical protein